MNYNKFCDTRFKKGDAFTAIVKGEKKTLVVKYKGGSYLVAKHPFLKGDIHVYYNNIISYTKQYKNDNPFEETAVEFPNEHPSYKKRFKCIHPTSTLTRNREYNGYYKKPFYKTFGGRMLKSVFSYSEARYIHLMNDYGRMVNVSKDRFIEV